MNTTNYAVFETRWRQTHSGGAFLFFTFVHKKLEEIVSASIMPQPSEYLQLLRISLTYTGLNEARVETGRDVLPASHISL